MDQILGQARAMQVLQAVLLSDRLHHAFLFHGPQGVGKFTTARALARIILCHDAQRDLSGSVIACGACKSCRLMPPPPEVKAPDSEPASDSAPAGDSQAHPDFHVIRKELARYSNSAQLRDRKQMNIPIDLLRERMLGGQVDTRFYEASAYKTPVLNHNKVFVIDEAHLLDGPGQNALLKTLEEPPAGTYVILVATSLDVLLPTIRSRCQAVAFVPLADEVVERWLGDRHAGLEDKARRWIVRFASGSIGRAELAVKYNLVSWAQVVIGELDEMPRGRYPASLGADLAGMIDEFAKRWVEEHKNASKEAANRMAAGLMWTLIGQHARGRLAELAGQSSPGDPEAAEAALEPWIGVIDALTQVEDLLDSNVNMGLACDHLVWAMFRSLSPAGSALDKAGAAASR